MKFTELVRLIYVCLSLLWSLIILVNLLDFIVLADLIKLHGKDTVRLDGYESMVGD